MKISPRSLLFAGFCLVLAVIATSVILPTAEAGKDRRKPRTTALARAASPEGVVTVVINETDADTAGVDAAEFVELKTAPGASLDGYVLVFFNGGVANDVSYLSIDLDGLVADSNGLVLIGNSGVPGVDRTFNNDTFQNGADGVGLYLGDATGFPNGTLPTATNLVDAVVYGTGDPDDTALMAILLNAGGAQIQLDENAFGAQAAHGARRCSDGTRDGRAFTIGIPTPNAPNNNCPDGKVDLNGDGKSDFLIIRSGGGGAGVAATSSVDRRDRTRRQRTRSRTVAAESLVQGSGPPLDWWGLESGTSGIHAVQWGDIFDHALTADFDGDRKDDITVWRPAGAGEFAYFLSINSSDYTLRQTAFGQLFDDPYVVGDYDGDGIDDPAVFRCPQDAPGTCYFYYRPSGTATTGFYAVPFGSGQGNDLLPYVGDFNGDGKQDFAVQTQSPTNANNGIFYIGMNGSLDVTGVEWGFFDDFLVPGDFDGDGKTDIVVTRVESGVLWWYVLEQDGGMQFVPWGLLASDVELVGDYNGDGRDDFAVHRDDGASSVFLVQPSGGGSHFGVAWGQPDDDPIANFFTKP